MRRCGARPHHVHGDTAEIDERQLSFQSAADHVVCRFVLRICMTYQNRARVRSHALRLFFLIETLAAHAIGTALQRENAVLHVRLKFVENRRVIFGEVEFCVVLLGPENLVRMRNRDGQIFRGTLACLCFRLDHVRTSGMETSRGFLSSRNPK